MRFPRWGVLSHHMTSQCALKSSGSRVGEAPPERSGATGGVAGHAASPLKLVGASRHRQLSQLVLSSNDPDAKARTSRSRDINSSLCVTELWRTALLDTQRSLELCRRHAYRTGSRHSAASVCVTIVRVWRVQCQTGEPAVRFCTCVNNNASRSFRKDSRLLQKDERSFSERKTTGQAGRGERVDEHIAHSAQGAIC